MKPKVILGDKPRSNTAQHLATPASDLALPDVTHQIGSACCNRTERHYSKTRLGLTKARMPEIKTVLFLAAIVGLSLVGALAQTTGSIVAWGDNHFGKATVPAGLSNVIAIAAGPEHSMALTPEGRVIVWGHDSQGQTIVPGDLSNAVAIAAGGDFCLALKSDRTVVGWGTGATNVPAGLTNVTAIAAGTMHGLALRSDSTVVAWGDNYYGQTNVPTGLNGIVAIAGGLHHTLALKSNGTVVAWGDNYYGQTNVPAGLSGVRAIAAGFGNNLALKFDGTVVAWGDNYYGQTNVPAGLNGIVAIAAGSWHDLALKSDGTVIGWGLNADGVTVPPAGLSGVIAISGGTQDGLALVAPPSVQIPPASQTVEVGRPVGFRVGVAGGPARAYQWFFNDTAIIDATNSTLQWAAAQTWQAGSYTVALTNSGGAVTSSPAQLSVITPVERRPVAAILLTGEPGSTLHLDYADALGSSPTWVHLGTASLAGVSQYYFDISEPLPLQRFYQAWHTNVFRAFPALALEMVPAITLTGSIGNSVRVDYINAIGPTDGWVMLDTVLLTNKSQLYFDVSASNQPQRLYRLLPLP